MKVNIGSNHLLQDQELTPALLKHYREHLVDLYPLLQTELFKTQSLLSVRSETKFDLSDHLDSVSILSTSAGTEAALYLLGTGKDGKEILVEATLTGWGTCEKVEVKSDVKVNDCSHIYTIPNKVVMVGANEIVILDN